MTAMKKMNNDDQVYFKNELNNVNTKCIYNVQVHNVKFRQTQFDSQCPTAEKAVYF